MTAQAEKRNIRPPSIWLWKHIKRADGNWIYQATIGMEPEVVFPSVKATLDLKDIYDLVEFEEEIL
jgi:hypothetical protein